MTTVFRSTLRPILLLSKCIGLIDISCTMDSTGLLVHNVKSLFHIFFEITRLIVLLMLTYIYIYQHRSKILTIQVITLLRFWTNIIAARLSNNWIIE
ncbi:Uncharacterized protein FWK35_00035322 [Aphis craccivora]|uniref:Gustatory receptor n=1 Tax=Aphis craccivora TaxID=307492 RepID=A0A6G0VQQ5_APHCR|nr:Uncharacterized protein FWK35_00035322 [Aphis craccivora]